MGCKALETTKTVKSNEIINVSVTLNETKTTNYFHEKHRISAFRVNLTQPPKLFCINRMDVIGIFTTVITREKNNLMSNHRAKSSLAQLILLEKTG